MRTIPIYCMPGMAASPKIFEFIDLSDKFEIYCLSWITPKENELLSVYAKRMCNKVKHKNPILLGVSFGGILVQEMAKYISVHKIIIISSIKSRIELPFPMKMAKKTNAHKLLPTQWINNIDLLAMFSFGSGIKKRISLYQRYLSERNPKYLNWAIDSLVNWEQENVIDNIIHIQGISDNVFPVKNLIKPFIKIRGGHAIIITQAKWFNKELPKIIQNI